MRSTDRRDAAPDGPALPLDEAARYLATTPRHLRRLYSERRIAFVKVGRKVAFLRGDLNEHLRTNRVEASR